LKVVLPLNYVAEVVGATSKNGFHVNQAIDEFVFKTHVTWKDASERYF